jgi:phosphohistidine phosphatase SixA
MSVKILLIRHATRSHVLADRDDPLSAAGEKEALGLAKAMKESGDVPMLFLTSKQRHAHQTTEILWCYLNPEAALVPLEALTPRVPHPLTNSRRYVEAISHDLGVFAKARPEIKDRLRETAAIILHEPRNIQCALQLQGKDPDIWETYRDGRHGGKWPGFGQAICLTADTWDHFLQGKGSEIVGGACC